MSEKEENEEEDEWDKIPTRIDELNKEIQVLKGMLTEKEEQRSKLQKSIDAMAQAVENLKKHIEKLDKAEAEEDDWE